MIIFGRRESHSDLSVSLEGLFVFGQTTLSDEVSDLPEGSLRVKSRFS